jgi:carbon-monoxide dehydrogenase medium subunit
MKPAPFDYHCPETLPEALKLLATLENARPLAGGQSLMPMLNLRLATPDHLVDLGRIAEISQIEERGDVLRIGAMTTQRTLEKSGLIQRKCPLLCQALERVGHQQTRNRGTIGGSICHLDPSAELPIVAMALDARLEIQSQSGRRELPFKAFPDGYLTSVLTAGEMLTHIEFPILPDRTGTCFEEFSRRPADFAIVAVAVVLSLGPDEMIVGARIAIGGLGPAPVRLESAEEMLAGKIWAPERVDAAGQLARGLSAEGDDDNTAEYRRHLAGVLTRRALHTAYARGREVQHV